MHTYVINQCLGLCIEILRQIKDDAPEEILWNRVNNLLDEIGPGQIPQASMRNKLAKWHEQVPVPTDNEPPPPF